MNDALLDRLRCAATLLHVTDGLTARLRAGDEVVSTITPIASGPDTVTPCGFRMAVGNAMRVRSEGRFLRIRHAHDDAPLVIDIGVPCGASLCSSGIASVPAGSSIRHTMAIATDLDTARPAVLAAFHAVDIQGATARLTPDELLGTCAVTVTTPTGDRSAAAAAHAVMLDAGARAGVAAIERHLGRGVTLPS